MSKYREVEPMKKHEDPDFDDLERLEKLLRTNKLTDNQKESLSKLLQFYYFVVD